jgi:hypothetical protein
MAVAVGSSRTGGGCGAFMLRARAMASHLGIRAIGWDGRDTWRSIRALVRTSRQGCGRKRVVGRRRWLMSRPEALARVGCGWAQEDSS